MSPEFFLESGQSQLVLVENLLDRPSDHCLLDHGLLKVHRPKTQHRNADGLSERRNDYKKHERQLGELHLVAEKWNFLSQEEYDKLPLVP